MPDCIANFNTFSSPIYNDPNFPTFPLEFQNLITPDSFPEIEPPPMSPNPTIEDFLPGHYSIDYIDNIFGRTYFLLQHIKIENKQELIATATWDQMGKPLS